MTRHLALTATLFAAIAAAPAADWHQYRGPNGDGTTDEKILTTWPAEGAKVAWKIPMGEGFGVLAVVGDRGYLMAERMKQEVCVCLDVATGKEIWQTTLGPGGGNAVPMTFMANGKQYVAIASGGATMEELNRGAHLHGTEAIVAYTLDDK